MSQGKYVKQEKRNGGGAVGRINNRAKRIFWVEFSNARGSNWNEASEKKKTSWLHSATSSPLATGRQISPMQHRLHIGSVHKETLTENILKM